MKKVGQDTIVCINKEIVQKELDGITYLMNSHDMTIHTLNQTAADIWKKCKTKTSIRTLSQYISKKYAVPEETAARDVLEFVQMYITHAMLRVITPS